VESPQTLDFDFAGTTQFGSAFGVSTLSQDGFTSGRMAGFSVGPDGTVIGRYTNGQTRTLGQVALANFANPQGLQQLGDNQWAESSSSGAPLVGAPGTASLGVLQSSSTEDSNVDLTAELVNMIVAQRAYQANAQTIKTQDAIQQTLMNLR
jgi:flagellar hook protein FlgE